MRTCTVEGCDRPHGANGLCRVHYRQKQVKDREGALKDIIVKIDQIMAKRPDLVPLLDDITKSIKPMFRDFKPKKNLNAADVMSELASLRAQIAELKGARKR